MAELHEQRAAGKPPCSKPGCSTYALFGLDLQGVQPNANVKNGSIQLVAFNEFSCHRTSAYVRLLPSSSFQMTRLRSLLAQHFQDAIHSRPTPQNELLPTRQYLQNCKAWSNSPMATQKAPRSLHRAHPTMPTSLNPSTFSSGKAKSSMPKTIFSSTR